MDGHVCCVHVQFLSLCVSLFVGFSVTVELVPSVETALSQATKHSVPHAPINPNNKTKTLHNPTLQHSKATHPLLRPPHYYISLVVVRPL